MVGACTASRPRVERIKGGDEAAEDFRSRETSPSARFGLASTWEAGLNPSLHPPPVHILQYVHEARKIAPLKFQIDGGHKFMLSYSRSSGLNSVATGVRTGAFEEPLG